MSYTDDKPTSGPSQPRLIPAGSFVNAIKASNGPLLGAILSFPQVMSAKLAARAGFHWVMIDMEHSPFSAQQVTELVHVVIQHSQGTCLPVIRIPSHGTEWIKWALDSGAAGIIIPMVHTVAEAEDIVDKALYPPRGSRSFGPYNAPFADLDTTTAFPDYYTKAQARDVAILPILESREAVKNAEAIMAIDGITGVFLGPYDLRLSLGLPGGSDGPEPEFVEAVEKICAIGKKLGKPVGSMGAGEELACKRAKLGMDFLLCSFDYNALVKGYKADRESAAQGVERALKL